MVILSSKKLLSAVFAIFLLILIIVLDGSLSSDSSNSNSYRRDAEAITILADDSLRSVMTELSRNYSADNALNIAVIYNQSEELINSIITGEPADLFITDNPDHLEDLKLQGHIDVKSLSLISSNRLVLVSNSQVINNLNLPAEIKEVFLKIKQRTLITIPDPAISYAGKIVEKYFSDNDLKNIFDKISVRAPSTKESLYLIKEAETVGITYITDYKNTQSESPNLKILAEFPDDSGIVNYQAAVVAGDSMDKAREFLNYLKTEKALKVFEKHNFATFKTALN